MLRVAVCDDIPFCVERLAGSIAAWSKERGMIIQIMKFRSGEEILFEIENSGDFAAVFLDIELSGINGIETAEKLYEQNRFIHVVFVSQYDTYFKEMFRGMYPVQFLEKPVRQGRIFRIMDQIEEQQKCVYENFQFQYNHHIYSINLREVMYFVSERRIVRILLMTGREYRLYDKLDEVERLLKGYKNPFVRIHQSYLVNSLHIENYHRRRVMLRNKDVLPVSRSRKSEVARFQMDFLAKRGLIMP